MRMRSRGWQKRGGVGAIEPLEPRTLLSGNGKPNMVLKWIDVTVAALKADRTHAGPGWSSRNEAIVSAAVYDAVNGIDHIGQMYDLSVAAPRHASANAAAAGAAYEALVQLYPVQKPMLDAALADSLASLPRSKHIAKSVAYGEQVGSQMCALRANDGANVDAPYTPGTAPGDWQPTPPDFSPAWGPSWRDVTPFAMDIGSEFRPPAPPAMTSADYTAAFNQVKSLGAANSTTRTADQMQIANFWAYDTAGTGTPPAHYDQIVETIAKQQHNSFDENARLFALVNMSQADAGIAAWDAKFEYNFWRPITGIRNAGADGNPNTVADPNWMPLGAPGDGTPNFTPPFPSYISGHSTFGGAVFQTLKLFYGTDHIHFTITSDELPGVTRSYNSFTQAENENGMSRIYLGIHWMFDNTEGIATGQAVADQVFSHTMQIKPQQKHDAIFSRPPSSDDHDGNLPQHWNRDGTMSLLDG